MATKKTKQSSKKGEAVTTDTTNSWLDIPIQLRKKIRRQHVLFQFAHGSPGVTKSWKTSPKRCPPIEKFTLFSPQLCDTIDHRGYDIGGYQIPIWDTSVPIKETALSFSDHENFILLVVTGISHPSFVYYKRNCSWDKMLGYNWSKYYPEEHKWVKQDCTIIDPHCSNQNCMQFCNVVGSNGKFYALSLQGTLVVIEEINSRMVITNVSKSRAVSSEFSKYFREYLTESCGEIMLIFLIFTKSASVVDKVEIFRLQILPKLAWKKVESLGDKVVVAGADICWIVDRRELRCKGNCVYFTNHGAHGWWVYDVAKGDILPGTWRRDSEDFSFPSIRKRRVIEEEEFEK